MVFILPPFYLTNIREYALRVNTVSWMLYTNENIWETEG